MIYDCTSDHSISKNHNLSACTNINKLVYELWISDLVFFYHDNDNNEDKKWGQNHDKLN